MPKILPPDEIARQGYEYAGNGLPEEAKGGQNMMIATTADARYAPGMEMIAANANLTARVRELEQRVEFYKNIWGQVCDENDRLRELLAAERRESARARAAGERAERRRRDPYLKRIYGISVGGRVPAWRCRT